VCNAYIILFAALNLKREEIQGKKVIEVGSKVFDGSVRPLLESYGPKQYVGVDISAGPGVDVLCNAENLLDVFQPNSFDVVLSTEMLEHVRNWQKVISGLKALTRPEGLICLTTRSHGFPYHAYPYDFWRYETQDVQNIFSDCVVDKVEQDPQIGVFAKIRKPTNFKENELSTYKLYSIVANKRVAHLDEDNFQKFLQSKEMEKRLSYMKVRLFRCLRKLLGFF
jgi:predicted SAM-dependent methyltransferase